MHISSKLLIFDLLIQLELYILHGCMGRSAKCGSTKKQSIRVIRSRDTLTVVNSFPSCLLHLVFISSTDHHEINEAEVFGMKHNLRRGGIGLGILAN